MTCKVFQAETVEIALRTWLPFRTIASGWVLLLGHYESMENATMVILISTASALFWLLFVIDHSFVRGFRSFSFSDFERTVG
jgi:hypothetical protein